MFGPPPTFCVREDKVGVGLGGGGGGGRNCTIYPLHLAHPVVQSKPAVGYSRAGY